MSFVSFADNADLDDIRAMSYYPSSWLYNYGDAEASICRMYAKTRRLMYRRLDRTQERDHDPLIHSPDSRHARKHRVDQYISTALPGEGVCPPQPSEPLSTPLSSWQPHQVVYDEVADEILTIRRREEIRNMQSEFMQAATATGRWTYCMPRFTDTRSNRRHTNG